MKISHNNHSYLSPSKLNSITSLPVSVKTLLSPSPPNATENTYTAADLNELIVSNSNTLSKYHDDERNDNSVSRKNGDTNVIISPPPSSSPPPSIPTPTPTRYTSSALTDNRFNKTIVTDLEDYADEPVPEFNELTINAIDHDQSLSPSDPDTSTTTTTTTTATNNHLKLNDFTETPSTLNVIPTKASSPSIAIELFQLSASPPASATTSIVKSTSRELSISDYSPLNRNQNADDLLLTIANTPTTSGTLNSWTGTNNEFARKESTQTSTSTRKPLLSTQNRFLSLSISPPLSRRQDMPVLRGTFVSL